MSKDDLTMPQTKHWGQLHEPRFEPDGVLRWIEAAVEDAFQWTDGVPLTSLKPFFFAERETVFVFDGQQFRSQLPSVPKRVFFGVKACDAAALAVQDRFFCRRQLLSSPKTSSFSGGGGLSSSLRYRLLSSYPLRALCTRRCRYRADSCATRLVFTSRHRTRPNSIGWIVARRE